MTQRPFIGSVLSPDGSLVARGRITVEVIQPAAEGIAGQSTFDVVDGAILDMETGLPVSIASPANYRMWLRYRGRTWTYIDSVGVTESADPVTWQELVDSSGETVEPSLIVRAGDDVTRLAGTGDAGDVPTLQADGSIVWGPQTGASGAVTSVNGMTGAVVIDDATTTASGLMSAADKSKLEAVEAGATANASNAALRDRSTHTGTQAISTVTGLQTALDGKEAVGTAAAAVAALVDSAPATLDTLNELAAALADDAAFSTTVTEALAARLPLAGGTMTGPLVLEDGGTATTLGVAAAVTAGTMATVQDATTRTANTTAINAAITLAQALGVGVRVTSFCWADVGVTTNGAACEIVGTTRMCGIGTIDTSGILLDMRVTSGYAMSPTNMTLFGPCEYIPTNEYPGGTIPTTFTTVMLAVGRTTGAGAQHLKLEGMHILGGYDCVTLTNATLARVQGNTLQHARRSLIYIDNPLSSDSGDTIIADNHLHVANSTAPGYDAAVTCALQVDACSGLYVRGNKVYMRSDVGFNVNLAHATFDDATAPQIKHIFEDNYFDSGGLVSGSNCIKIRSAWGSGGTGTAVTGNRISGVVVSRNVGHNCANLLDLSSFSGGITNIDIADNVMFGGGGITLAGTIDRIRITGNTFDDGGWTGSYGPAKPVTSTATITNGSYTNNTWLGFSSAPDLADTGGGSAAPIAETTVVISSGAATFTPDSSQAGPHHAYTKQDANATLTLVATDGQSGVWKIAQSGAGHTLALAATGKTIRWEGGSAPTLPSSAVDDRVDAWVWRCEGADVVSRYETLGTIAGYTTEGGGGSSIIFDSFTGTLNTSIGGRAPDTTNTPGNNWADTTAGAWKLTGSGAAKETLGGQAKLTIDAEDADVTIIATFVLASTDFSLGGLVFNWTDVNNNWKLRFRQSDSLIFVTGLNAGSATDYYGADHGGGNYIGGSAGALAAGTYEVKVVTNGDNVKWYVDGTLYGDLTVTTRPTKTATSHGLYGPAAGQTNFTVTDFDVQSS